mmetsp:Transcript_2472/g.7844  ORF Transcript_2472/g.7844 Transcript_2472/m.7844 type:complete len:479 (+) Transcript_2472:552-1988(+)
MRNDSAAAAAAAVASSRGTRNSASRSTYASSSSTSPSSSASASPSRSSPRLGQLRLSAHDVNLSASLSMGSTEEKVHAYARLSDSFGGPHGDPHDEYHNLVFEGGGVKGLSCVGAIEVMEERGILTTIQRVAGTSAGAIVSTPIAFGIPASEIRQIMLDTPYKRFTESRFGVLGIVWRLLWGHRGVFEGEYITQWIKENIANFVSFHYSKRDRQGYPTNSSYENFTFRQLHERVVTQRATSTTEPNKYKDLYIIATDITHQRPEVFSYETTPDWPIWEAVRASMSIPVVFDPFQKEDLYGDRIDFIDGGLTWNYPINLFDSTEYYHENQRQMMLRESTHMEPPTPTHYMKREMQRHRSQPCLNTQTIGVKIENEDEIQREKGDAKPTKLANIMDLALATYDFTAYMANKERLHPYDAERSCTINCGDIRATDFNISVEQKRFLMHQGRTAMTAFLDRQREIKDQTELYAPFGDHADYY